MQLTNEWRLGKPAKLIYSRFVVDFVASLPISLWSKQNKQRCSMELGWFHCLRMNVWARSTKLKSPMWFECKFYWLYADPTRWSQQKVKNRKKKTKNKTKLYCGYLCFSNGRCMWVSFIQNQNFPLFLFRAVFAWNSPRSLKSVGYSIHCRQTVHLSLYFFFLFSFHWFVSSASLSMYLWFWKYFYLTFIFSN